MADNTLNCGHSGPDWDGNGNCIKCARDKVLGKSRQEEAYEFVSSTFVKLLEKDDRISYDHKRSVIAFWEDLFAHDGVRNNMEQAFSNFLWEIDKKMESARKAGIMLALSTLELGFPNDAAPADVAMTKEQIVTTLEGLLKMEETPEEPTIEADDLENMDLSEVGGGDEDDTSPL